MRDGKTVERGVVQHNADRCPKCDSGLVDGLAQENGIRRYQCRACGELYTALIGKKVFGDVQGEPVARLPDDPRFNKSKTPYKNFRFGEELWKSPFSRTALGEANRKEATVAKFGCNKCGERPRRPRALAFTDTKVVCPHCTKVTLQYYGKPDWVAFVRDGKPVRFWCPKCERKFDANVKPGLTDDEDERTVTQVDN